MADDLQTHRESQQLEAAVFQVMAAEMWRDFDKNERNLVRYGMFPAGKMESAERAYIQREFPHCDVREIRDFSRKLAVALMDQAKANGGMHA